MPSRRQARRRWSSAFGADSARDYASTDFLADRGQSLGDDDHRPIVNLLVEQIEFADVIVLNKLDIAKPHEIEAARAIIRSLNAEAKIVKTTEGRAPLGSILATGLFDFEKAQQHPLWQDLLARMGEAARSLSRMAARRRVIPISAPWDIMAC